MAVAELVCTGLTNRDVAVKLFISQKTVEANVGRIYRKLNIHSRAQLIRHMCQPQAKPVGTATKDINWTGEPRADTSAALASNSSASRSSDRRMTAG